MLVLLAQKPRAIAWLFISLFYLELALMPVAAKASIHYPRLHAFSSGNSRGLANAMKLTKTVNEGSIAPSSENKPVRIPAIAVPAPEIGGPTQPEMTSFSSVNGGNLVDLFTGNFSYSIPLLDVGGYPVALGYSAGASMDQEASWVGLGWNINPGTITRNLRGLPDDFKGDTIVKTVNMKDNKTIGVSAGADIELAGWPAGTAASKMVESTAKYQGVTFGASYGITHNNYKGWGIEHSISVGINAGQGAKGPFSGSLGLNNSTMDGLTISPTLSFADNLEFNNKLSRLSYSGSLSLPYNSRSGLGSLQLSTGVSLDKQVEGSYLKLSRIRPGAALISFATPAGTPDIQIPYTSYQFSYNAKVGLLTKVYHPSFHAKGYVSKQYIDKDDKTQYLSAFGYLNYQDAAADGSSLLDFNKEKELPYREKPAYPHIGLPSYTYDAFSMSGEGTGGMFRAYRGDIGFVYDHAMRTKSVSGNVSLDIGVGDMVQAGGDVVGVLSTTATGPWTNLNPFKNLVRFRKSDSIFQSAYFRNPGEKSINSKEFYDALGGDDVVSVQLIQPHSNSSIIHTGNKLNKHQNGRITGYATLTENNSIRRERGKRNQVISYLTAREADAAGLSKYIENYTLNVFDSSTCRALQDNVEGFGPGLSAQLFGNEKLSGPPLKTWYGDQELWYDLRHGYPMDLTTWTRYDWWSVKWNGRILAPQTGKYEFQVKSDDGFYLNLNGVSFIDTWNFRNFESGYTTKSINLEAGQFYDLDAALFDGKTWAGLELKWKIPGSSTFEKIPREMLYPKAIDSFNIKDLNNNLLLVKEKRVNDFRKPHHISEISVLNEDGRRYVYGIPVYNLKQKDVVFNVDGVGNGNLEKGLVKYGGNDNTVANSQGKDNYFSSQEMPAYAHSFLLTAILSDDYSDLTGNGISDDDLGNAVKFNYSKVRGVKNPFQWRTPAAEDSASFNEGLRTDSRDDKGTYVYGEKELWYLHSIESKTMVATFKLSDRLDMPGVDEKGKRTIYSGAKKLDEINLYSKADFAANKTNARPIKTIHFEYSYELCRGYSPQDPGNFNIKDSGKLTLKSVWFSYNGNNQPKAKSSPYEFRYNTFNPRYNNQANDRWGTFKDPLDNPGSTTGNLIRNAEFPYAVQDSTLAARNAGAWNLDSILLPSGGSMKIDYESDDYGYVQNKAAMQMYKIAGFSEFPVYATASSRLYNHYGGETVDTRYVFIKVPVAVTTAEEVYNTYLNGIDRIFVKVFVKVPKDKYNNGQTHEYIPTYVYLDKSPGSYGVSAPGIIYVKLSTVDKNGNTGGSLSPIVKAATQFLKLNLPSKAYPGSEIGDAIDLDNAIKLLIGLASNIISTINGFDNMARDRNWLRDVDTSRSFVRLLNPNRKKYGGGHRVKRITIYDNWNKMTNQRTAKYGQEYIYTTEEYAGGARKKISSGVAVWEPLLGGEENPFRMPIDYVDQPAVLLPSIMGYTEEPLGESFYPAASVGYSKVRVRTINYLNKKSANGWDDTQFYTAKDYPVYTERSVFDVETKKRYKPRLSNFFRINAHHYLALTQGFKVELNDMHGKLRSKASYPENDTANYLNYVEYFYKNTITAEGRRLSNIVSVITPTGAIDTAALIGKDLELMVDMREQESLVQTANLQLNSLMFSAPSPLGFLLALIPIDAFQRERNLYQSAAATKVIQRYGIIDSVLAIDKGSRISTADMMYDSETGEVLLTRTQNEFDDYVYNFKYPAHWAYKGIGPAYKNIDAVYEHVSIRDGKLVSPPSNLVNMFANGDEILIGGKSKTGGSSCNEEIAAFPSYHRIWCVDSSEVYGGSRSLYFIDRKGKPYTGFDISVKVIRSGYRNIAAGVGAITSLSNPVRKVGQNYQLVVDDDTKVIAASSNEFKQIWKVQDLFAQKESLNCLPYWLSTGKFRCVQVNGVNTGMREAEVADSNKNSSTYRQAKWVSLGLRCKDCPTPPRWVRTALPPICETIGGSTLTGTNNNVTTMASQRTGYKLYQYIDSAACSSTYLQIKWERGELDCVTCSGGTNCAPVCNNCDESENLYKCINGICESPEFMCYESIDLGGNLYYNSYAYFFSDGTMASLPEEHYYNSLPCDYKLRSSGFTFDSSGRALPKVEYSPERTAFELKMTSIRMAPAEMKIYQRRELPKKKKNKQTNQ